MSRMLRDPWYVVSLAVLFGVIAVSLGFAGGSSAASTPNASPIPSTGAIDPTPAAEPPRAPAQAALDARRAEDLDADAAALEIYRTRNGAYPSSEENFMTFCKLAFDPGCQVIAVTTKISAGDGTYPYWYRSDGKTYTLFARAEAESADSRCPSELPPQLVSAPVLCVSAPGGTR